MPLSQRARLIDNCFQLALAGNQRLAAAAEVARLDEAGQKELVKLCHTHHVLVRALAPVYEIHRTKWVGEALEAEHERVANAIEFVSRIADRLESNGCPTVVIKSLDHLPDLGSDLDLYTSAERCFVTNLMRREFGGVPKPRSWGDRLADKLSFAVPGLPEVVEVHHRRLGQTGEHTTLAKRFLTRRVFKQIAGFAIPVPAPEEQIIAATLQRVYRHFFLRICDVVNIAHLVTTNQVDFAELERASQLGGIRPGVASLLNIVSDHVLQYGGKALPLPAWVTEAARIRGREIFLRGELLRVPVMKHAPALYSHQLAELMKRGEFRASARLSLLPPLASAARVAYKLTGDHRGIW